jgi:hypothetical protein
VQQGAGSGGAHVCLSTFVYKDWTAEGMVPTMIPNEWIVPARRDSKVRGPGGLWCLCVREQRAP